MKQINQQAGKEREFELNGKKNRQEFNNNNNKE